MKRWHYQLQLAVHNEMRHIYLTFDKTEDDWKKREAILKELIRNTPEDDNEPYGA